MFPSSRHTYVSPSGNMPVSTASTAVTAATATTATATGSRTRDALQTTIAADLAQTRQAALNTTTRAQMRGVNVITTSLSATQPVSLPISLPEPLSLPVIAWTETSSDLPDIVGSATSPRIDTPSNTKRREYEADAGPDGDTPPAKRPRAAPATSWEQLDQSDESALVQVQRFLSDLSHASPANVTSDRAHPRDLPSTSEGGGKPFDESENFDFLTWQRETFGIAPTVRTGSHCSAATLSAFGAPSNELPHDREERLLRVDTLPILPQRDAAAAAPGTYAVDKVSDDALYTTLSDLAAGHTTSLKCKGIEAHLTSANYVEARRLLERLIDKLETSHRFEGNWLSAFEALHGWSVTFEARSEQTLSAALISTGNACQEQVRSLAQSATRTRFNELTAFRLHAMFDMPPQQRATEWNGLLASLQRCRDMANAQTLRYLTNFIARLSEETRLPPARAIFALGSALPKHSDFRTSCLFSALGDADKLSLADHCLEEAPDSHILKSILYDVIKELPRFPSEDASRLMQRIADITIGPTDESWGLSLSYNTRANIMRALTSTSEDDKRDYERPDFREMKREWIENVDENLGD